MARILYLSPLPPEPTGIAGYSRAVLEELRETGFTRRHRVETPWPLRGRVGELVRASDLAVYHVGNNMAFHRDIYALAVSHPGLLVLHDVALDDLARALIAVDDPLGPPTRAEAMVAARTLGRSAPDMDEPLRVPWCALVARRSLGVVVHSEFGRRYLAAFGCRTPTYVVPHPLVESSRSLRRARREAPGLRRQALAENGGVLIGVLGDLGQAKGIGAVLEAAARLERPVHVAVVGRRIPMYDAEEVVAASRIGDRVTVAQDVSDSEFLAWLHACDVVVNLRYPHRGEVSGTLIRALHAGVPVVVSATGTYLDWPEDVVVRVPAGPPDPGALVAALRPLVEDPGRRGALGERARAHIARYGAERATARGYERAIESTLGLVRDPGRVALSRWAAALADCGADAGAVNRGLGMGYAAALEELFG
jgi:glycosyltransferase involved in cell wall biosynthesis